VPNLPSGPSTARDHEPLDGGDSRQVALLRQEIRRLTGQISRQAAHAAAATEVMAAELAATRAALADAILERDTILASTGWRALGLAQRVTRRLPPIIVRAIQALTAGLKTRTARVPADEPTQLAIMREVTVQREVGYDDWWRAHATLTDEDRATIRDHVRVLAQGPLISIVMTPGDVSDDLVQKTISSLNRQLYPSWELCLDGIASAKGEFVAWITPGDLLAEQALYEVAVVLDADPTLHLVYTDEDAVDDHDRHFLPSFKPAWSIEAFLGHDTVGRLAVYRRSLVAALDWHPNAIGREQDHALALRVVACSTAAQIRHLPGVLYHERAMEDGKRRDPEALTKDSGPSAVWEALRRTHRLPPIVLSPLVGKPGFSRLRLSLPVVLPRVTAIIPTRDHAELLARATAGLLYRTDYPNLEVLIINNDSIDPWAVSLFHMLRKDKRVKVMTVPGPFNYAALNNAGVREATGEIILLLNNDIDITDSSWLREMVSHAVRPDVGAVGAKLIYEDGRIQHAGVVLGVGRLNGRRGVAGHFGHYAEADEEGHFGQYLVTREVSAVTGACLMVRREVYLAAGGLDEEHLPVSYNDVDLCLRIRELGLRNVWTPFAELYHLESASRGGVQSLEQVARAEREFAYMRDRWSEQLENDPFYNQNFDRKDHSFALVRTPRAARRSRAQSGPPYDGCGEDLRASLS
jgi:GT2 family glycosyltransferase